MTALRSSRPFGALFNRLQARSGNREALQQTAQLALQVEFATIPVYLSGMYSITDPNAAAYQTLRSVLMEEMFHLNQAANLVVGLGALPRFTGDAAPSYPGYLPHASESSTPLLGLYRASSDVFANVYSAIETPAPPGAPPQGDHYDSIAQLYAALWQAIVDFPGDPFAQPAAGGRQRNDIYLGKFGGTVFIVTDRDSAAKGITQIVKQGEGSVPNGEPLVDTEPFGAYNHYGERSDGTYGPIIGTPVELSHFSKFRKIAVDDGGFPATFPVLSNPDPAQYSNPDATALDALFNQAYSLMLRGFERTFTVDAEDPYFGVVLNLMHGALPQLALSLMNTPALAGGDASVGPNAAPSFRWVADASLQSLHGGIDALMHRASLNSSQRDRLANAAQHLGRLPQSLVQRGL